jgi:environmental stress-induced protein Ves
MTTEALVLPPGATSDDFELRVSMALIERDGPFSEFPGVDRTLVVIEGAGLTLEMADGATVVLDAASSPFAFTGDDPVCAKLTGDHPVRDVNVMTRRSVLRHRVARVEIDGPRTLACAGELGLLLVLGGGLTAKGDEELQLGKGDVLTVSTGEAVALQPTAPTSALLVDVFRR